MHAEMVFSLGSIQFRELLAGTCAHGASGACSCPEPLPPKHVPSPVGLTGVSVNMIELYLLCLFYTLGFCSLLPRSS